MLKTSSLTADLPTMATIGGGWPEALTTNPMVDDRSPRQRRRTKRAERRARERARELATRRRMGTAPGPIFNLLVLLAMVIVLVDASTPTFGQVTGGVSLFFLLVMFCIWLVRLNRRTYAPPSTGWRTDPRWFAAPFVAGCLMIGLLVADVPFHLRWPSAEPAFARAAHRIPVTGSRTWHPVPGGDIAGFPISEVRRDGRAVWFHYHGESGIIDFHSRYIAYLPDGADQAADRRSPCSCTSVTSLGDGWYYLHDDAD